MTPGIEEKTTPVGPPPRPFVEDRHRELFRELAAFVAEEIAPLPPPRDDDGAREQARRILALLGSSGHLALAVGGVELRSCCIARETLGAASPLADAVLALQALGSRPIHAAGTEELKRRWLPGIASGELMAGFAMTEPEAGSDAGSMATRARRDGSVYVLDGEKTFISNAGIADVYVVFAATEPEGRTRGLGAFVVPADSTGLEFTGAQVMSAPHPLGSLRFDGCRIPTENRLGAESDGFRIAMETLDRLRPTVAAAACGMAAAALDESLAFARGREQFGRPIADFQLVRGKLADMATELDAARLLTYRAAWIADTTDEPVTLPASMAKAHATEAAQRIVDEAVQIHGGRGVLADSKVDLLYRSVRALRIYEGTTEIQRLVIAKHLLKDPR